MPTLTEDKVAIQEIMHRYALMVDRHEWQLMDSIFAPQGTVDYSSTGGKSGGYKETLAWLERALAPWPLNLHFISNAIIEINGDEASSTCAFQAPMGRLETDGTQTMMTNIGYYHDTWLRCADNWRIQHRRCEQTMMLGELPANYEIPS